MKLQETQSDKALVEQHPKISVVLERAYAKIFTNFMAAPRYRDKFPELSHFVAIKGSHYGKAFDKNKRELRLMLIGRSANGWPSCHLPQRKRDESETSSEEQRKKIYEDMSGVEFGKYCSKKFNDTERFEWISPNFTSWKNKKYHIRKSPFWNVSEKIWNKVAGEESRAPAKCPYYRWFEHIAWSNLYKISPSSGNPGERMMHLQRQACVEILKTEIRELKPTVIIMITDRNWFCPFHGLFADISSCQDSDLQHICATACFKRGNADIPVIITSRPERQRQKDFVDATVKAFNLLCEK